MLNEGNKCLPPSVITLPQYRGGKFFLRASRATLNISPPLAKTYIPPLTMGHNKDTTDRDNFKFSGFHEFLVLAEVASLVGNPVHKREAVLYLSLRTLQKLSIHALSSEKFYS